MTSIAKSDFDSISKFQNELHTTTDDTQTIESIFMYEFRKITWYTMIPMKLSPSVGEDDGISYIVNNTFHYLIYTDMRQQLPAIKVKPEYKGKVKIAWCHNIGSNIFTQGEFLIEDESLNTISNVWCDIYFQAYMTPGFREHHDKGIGNLPFLEGWNDSLPEYITNVNQPFYYSKSTNLAFPIFLASTQSIIKHKYLLRKKISSLLRMIKTDDEGKTWKQIPYDYSYLDNVTKDQTLKNPELWARYGYISSGEMGATRCHDTLSFYIDDIVTCSNDSAYGYKSTSTVELQSIYPCKAMFWVAENLEATGNNNYSNYTTNSNNLYKGWNPCRKINLKYGDLFRLKEMDADHFDIGEYRKHFPSPPSEPGFNAYSFAYNSASVDGEVGIVFYSLKAKLLIDIREYDIEQTDNNNLIKNNTQFKTHVILLVTKRLVVEKSSSGNYKFSTEPSPLQNN